MMKVRKHVTKIFDESTHAFNVSFHIMRVILFRHLIGVNFILYIAPDMISQVSDVLIYPDVIFLNIIIAIRQDLTEFYKPDMYVE